MSWRKWVLVGVAAVVVFAGAALYVNLHVAPAPNGYASMEHNVAFYPACGNSPLVQGGRTWYPISREDWATPSAKAWGPSGGRGVGASVPMVAAPGPGDDVGTLYIYRDGRAYWLSDSGDLDQWLTLVPQTYNWVC